MISSGPLLLVCEYCGKKSAFMMKFTALRPYLGGIDFCQDCSKSAYADYMTHKEQVKKEYPDLYSPLKPQKKSPPSSE